jgi:hypothetical protein
MILDSKYSFFFLFSFCFLKQRMCHKVLLFPKEKSQNAKKLRLQKLLIWSEIPDFSGANFCHLTNHFQKNL